MMKERALLSVGLIVVVAAIYFGYIAYKRRLVVYDGSGTTASTETATTDAGA